MNAVTPGVRRRRILAASVTLLALAVVACAAGPRGPNGGRNLRPTANPSAVIAAELAFARMAQEKGQWTAFADYAADDAVMFVPEAVNARGWLRKQHDPAQAVAWQPHQVWSSCDGSLAVTKGGWQRPDGSVGYFTTVWQRQRGGEYKWVLDQGDTLQTPLKEPEFVQASVAECAKSEGPEAGPDESAAGATAGGGAAKDGTLSYHYQVQPDGARELDVFMRTADAMEQVVASKVAAP